MQVRTSKGLIKGLTVGDNTRQYLGIPYGVARRFEEAVEPPVWDGVLKCSRVGPDVPQIKTGEVFTVPLKDGGRMGEEGSLCVNVTVPEEGVGGGVLLPVMVWIHGGAFAIGSGHNPSYDPVALCEHEKIIVVSFNYRVGALGFLYKSDSDIPPNLGIKDQILALRWVKKEIKNFNGDPSKVTIFGESAGAMSVGTLLSVSNTFCKGLFRAAIMQSGVPALISSRAADAKAAEFAKNLNVLPSQINKEFLSMLPVDAIIKAEQDMNIGLINFSPVIAGGFPHPFQAFSEGVGKEIPVLSGTNREEFNLWIGDVGEVDTNGVVKWVKGRIKECTDQQATNIVTAVMKESPEYTPKDVFSQVRTDFMFTIPHNKFLDAYPGPTYSYLLEYHATPPYRCSHLVDIPLVFGTHSAPAVAPFMGSPPPTFLSHLMMSHWGAFAKKLHPKWPKHNLQTRPTMVFGRGNHPTAEVCHRVRTDTLAKWEVKMAKL